MNPEHRINDVEQALRAAAPPMEAQAQARMREAVLRSLPARQLAPRRVPRRAFLLQPAFAAALALVLALGGTAYAANESLPGTALYPVKRAAENALVAIVPAGTFERQLLLGLAERRAEEAGILARQSETTQERAREAIGSLSESVRHATDPDPLQEQELLRLRARVGEVPTWAAPLVEDALAPGTGTSGSAPQPGTGQENGAQEPAEETPGTGGADAGTGGTPHDEPLAPPSDTTGTDGGSDATTATGPRGPQGDAGSQTDAPDTTDGNSPGTNP